MLILAKALASATAAKPPAAAPSSPCKAASASAITSTPPSPKPTSASPPLHSSLWSVLAENARTQLPESIRVLLVLAKTVLNLGTRK